MSELQQFEGASSRRDAIDLSKYFQNIDACLRNYRALRIYCDAALDQITLDLQAAQSHFKIDATLYSTARAKVTTAAIVELIDRQMEIYQRLCVLYGSERRYQVIRAKFFDFPDEDDEDPPYSNEELADYFDCSVDTIQRDLRLAKDELEILLFGATRL